ncbi:MAG: HAMP domain-containing protein [Acidobacteria bacterium]|nr:MAG: HAMP domain-containing protein [Acidobacteriota bacterium]
MSRIESKRRIYLISGFLGCFVLIYLASIVFLNPSSVGNTLFVWKLNLWAVVWALNFVVILVLLFILARDLIKLFFEYQSSRPGSQIKTKLVLTLVIFSLFPALIMLFLAFGLINRNLQQWFSSPAEQLLDSSRAIARRYYEQGRVNAISAATTLGQEARASNAPAEIDRRARERGFSAIVIYDQLGRLKYRSQEWRDELPGRPTRTTVLAGQPHYELKRNQEPEILVPGATRTDRGVVGIPLGEKLPASGALFLLFATPESVAFHQLQIEEAVSKYEAVKSGIENFKINYLAILAFTSLSIVFGFVWLGSYIARRLTGPLEALAEGSRELAAGNFDYRVDVKAVDELGILVNSFNRMAEQIKESRLDLEKANLELLSTNARLEERRAYIETILQNIATGVVSCDESDHIRTVNEAGLKILRTTRERMLNRSLKEIVDPELYDEFQRMKKRARIYGSYRSEVTISRNERELHIAVTVTSNPLPGSGQEEYLVVLDDLGELIKAEKFAAWQEVARRLAHEIKNPLTPIQLSAERLKKRFEKIPESRRSTREVREFEKVLSESTRIIIQESEMLKSLIQEFSRFARLPVSKPSDVALHELIERTLLLYDGGLASVRVCRNFDPRIGNVKLDPEQMQRVFVNLIDNSLDALVESSGERMLSIGTRLNEANRTVTVEIADNGAGIQSADYEHLFLPYFSTKKKGTGLGLAIVRQIVSEHNGFIRAEPNVPQGTRMILELPVMQ